MVFSEIRRFLRRGYLAAIVASIVLTVGFSGAAVTLNMIRALTRPLGAGLQDKAFATIAEPTSAGGLVRINWYSVEKLRSTVRLPGASMVAYAPPDHHLLQWHERAVQISVAFTERGFFTSFTRNLYAGRDFTSGLGADGDEGEAIISEELARQFFGSASKALDQNIRIAGRHFVIIGIAPKGFSGLWTSTDVWTTPGECQKLASDFNPKSASPVSWKVASIWYYLAEASPQIRPAPAQTIGTQLRSEANQSMGLQAVSGLSDDPIRDRDVHTSSQLGLVVAVALLLSAALNYCILLYARSSLSIEEFRLKRVLGAGPNRLAVDAASGPLFVVLVSFCASGVLTILVQHFLAARESNPLVASGLGLYSAATILAAEFPLACLLGVSIAVVPAFSLLRRSGAPKMGSTSTQTRRERMILNTIVVLEIAVCALVCFFAGSFVRQYYLLSQVHLGYDPQGLTSYEASIIKGSGTITISTSTGEDSPLTAFVRLSMADAREHLSGLQSIAAASCAPFGPPMKTIDLYRFQTGSEPLRAMSFCTVSQDYFLTIGASIDRGSGFTEADYHGDVNRAVINRTLAKVLWPQQQAINQMLRVDMPASNLKLDVRVIGVVNDTRQEGALSSPQPTIYLPLTGNAAIMSFPLYFVARGQQSSERFSEIVQRTSESTVNHLGIVRSYSIEEMIRSSWQEQNARLKVALFGALLVAFIAYAGLYGVLVHSISVRQKELALRLAFGASTWMLQRVAIQNALLCCFAAIGLALLLWRACLGLLDPRWMSGASWSWVSVGVVSLLCGFASIIISVIPARRAIQLSPASLLRNE
jgi:putative ABC transport system permease protein